MYLIIGLGNPGEEYAKTRHNLGFMVIDELEKRENFNKKTILAKPQTFMNNSGNEVARLMNWYKLLSEQLIVIYDDVDLPVGEVRVKKGGGAGGHHGIESILSCISSPNFTRVRVGIGRETATGDVSEYVLAKIPKEHKPLLDLAVIKAADAVELLVNDA